MILPVARPVALRADASIASIHQSNRQNLPLTHTVKMGAT
jgi:hypothetical protein